jgi:hypothetical protein
MEDIEILLVMLPGFVRSVVRQHLRGNRTTSTDRETIRRLRLSSGYVQVVTSSSRYWATEPDFFP